MQGDPDLKAWPVFAILVIQVILFSGALVRLLHIRRILARSHSRCRRRCAHCDARSCLLSSRCGLAVLSFPLFQSCRTGHLLVGSGAVWLGFVSFFLWGSVVIRLAWLAIRFSHLAVNPHAFRAPLAEVIYSIAALAGIYGLVNARIVRIRHVPVQIPNLPASWRGRRAVMMSDLHLGPINVESVFAVVWLRRPRDSKPDVVLITGDLFDGTKGDLDPAGGAVPRLTHTAAGHLLFDRQPPRGIYLASNNILMPLPRRASAFYASEQVEVDGFANRRRDVPRFVIAAAHESRRSAT